MADTIDHVRPIRRRSKTEVSAQIAISWARITANRQGAFADVVGVDQKTVRRALSGETTPELHTALNGLLFDPTALDEVLALYGFRLQPDRRINPDNDWSTIAGTSGFISHFAEAMADGWRNHRETCELADLLRPLMHQFAAIVAEADEIRGAIAP